MVAKLLKESTWGSPKKQATAPEHRATESNEKSESKLATHFRQGPFASRGHGSRGYDASRGYGLGGHLLRGHLLRGHLLGGHLLGE
jgi:hypothetical protein